MSGSLFFETQCIESAGAVWLCGGNAGAAGISEIERAAVHGVRWRCLSHEPQLLLRHVRRGRACCVHSTFSQYRHHRHPQQESARRIVTLQVSRSTSIFSTPAFEIFLCQCKLQGRWIGCQGWHTYNNEGLWMCVADLQMNMKWVFFHSICVKKIKICLNIYFIIFLYFSVYFYVRFLF